MLRAMPMSLKSRLFYGLRVALSLLPWVAAMYGFYWLDTTGTWTSETPHRGKLSVALLSAGMALSFLAWSWLAKRVDARKDAPGR